MHVLLTWKNEEDPIKNKGARVLTSLYVGGFFSDAQGQLTLEVSGGIPPKFELIQALMIVLVTCKNEGARVLTTFLPL